MKYLSDNIIENKNVILRCDFNVPVKNNIITDNSKIIKSLDTIKYLLEHNNRVIILSHFGRVKTEDDKSNNSLELVYEELKKYIDIKFIKENENIDKYLDGNKCYLLENTRFTDIPKKKESKNDLELAKYWASFGDVFVIDAFASLHRAHTSTAGISAYLETYLGFLVESELKNLDELINRLDLVVIMGGAKVDDKILIIKGLLKKCQKLIITGGILNTFLYVLGYNVGKSLISTDEEVLKDVYDIINNYKDKIVFSNEFVISRNGVVLKKTINELEDEDIIYDNIPNIDGIINNDSVVFLNGTCGKVEEDEYSIGTKTLLENLVKKSAKVFVGGGDAVASVVKFGYDNSFYYLSSGGGATLEYVSNNSLKALEFIEDNTKK